MYVVINSFRDKQDNKRLYKPGDIFPVEGVKVTKSRINELSRRHPETGKVYIEEMSQSPGGDNGEGEGSTNGEGEGSAGGED